MKTRTLFPSTLIRPALLLALLAGMLGGYPAITAPVEAITPAAETSTSIPARYLDDFPPGLAAALAQSWQDELPAVYRPTPTLAGYRAENPAHNMRFTFTTDGLQISDRAGDWPWGLQVTRWGYAGSLHPIPPARLTATGPDLEYQRGQTPSGAPLLTEWYRNTPWGLEQGFTINHPPLLKLGEAGQGGEGLELEQGIGKVALAAEKVAGA